MQHAIDPLALAWFALWCMFLLALFWLGTRLPPQPRLSRFWSIANGAAGVLIALALTVLANVALSVYDAHVDLAPERSNTPIPAAIDALDRAELPPPAPLYDLPSALGARERSTRASAPTVSLTAAQTRAVFLLTQIGVPLAVLLFGALVWWKRSR